MAFSLFPREEKFFQMFEQQAALISKGGQLLNKAIQSGDFDQSLVDKLFALSKAFSGVILKTK